MKFIEFTVGKQKISIVARCIQAVQQAGPEHKGKTLIVMARPSDDVEDYFIVDEPYREVQMMIINCEL